MVGLADFVKRGAPSVTFVVKGFLLGGAFVDIVVDSGFDRVTTRKKYKVYKCEIVEKSLWY